MIRRIFLISQLEMTVATMSITIKVNIYENDLPSSYHHNCGQLFQPPLRYCANHDYQKFDPALKGAKVIQAHYPLPLGTLFSVLRTDLHVPLSLGDAFSCRALNQ